MAEEDLHLSAELQQQGERFTYRAHHGSQRGTSPINNSGKNTRTKPHPNAHGTLKQLATVTAVKTAANLSFITRHRGAADAKQISRQASIKRLSI